VVLLQLLAAKPVQAAKALLLGQDGERDCQGGVNQVLTHLDARAGGWPAAGEQQWERPVHHKSVLAVHCHITSCSRRCVSPTSYVMLLQDPVGVQGP
jgi:hypothetical protein